jgi:hypothetical protein
VCEIGHDIFNVTQTQSGNVNLVETLVRDQYFNDPPQCAFRVDDCSEQHYLIKRYEPYGDDPLFEHSFAQVGGFTQ